MPNFHVLELGNLIDYIIFYMKTKNLRSSQIIIKRGNTNDEQF